MLIGKIQGEVNTADIGKRKDTLLGLSRSPRREKMGSVHK